MLQREHGLNVFIGMWACGQVWVISLFSKGHFSHVTIFIFILIDNFCSYNSSTFFIRIINHNNKSGHTITTWVYQSYSYESNSGLPDYKNNEDANELQNR